MFGWLKRLFSNASEDLQAGTVTNVINKTTEPDPIVEVYKADKPKAKKSKPKKAAAVDLSSMNKTELLAEAKKRGIKANASLKKDEILERINAG